MAFLPWALGTLRAAILINTFAASLNSQPQAFDTSQYCPRLYRRRQSIRMDEMLSQFISSKASYGGLKLFYLFFH